MKIQTTYPDHQSGAAVGTVGYGITQCSYDANNRRSICTDQAGDTQTFNYDLAGRLLSRDYRTAANSPSGTIADTDSFTYDRSSRMLTATSGRYNNVCSMTYDSAGRKETESLTVEGQVYTTTVGYDVANRQNQMIYPDGTILNRSYTDRHQLEQLTYDGNVVDTRAYDNGGRLTSCTLGNGIVDSRTYNNDNTLASISSSNADIGTYSYTWDANKNKTNETITGPLADYSFTTGPTGYDTEDRLTEYTRGTLNQQWGLSLEGDWNTFTENGVTQNRTHGPTHEIDTVGAAAVTHDVKGNVTSKPSSLNPADTSVLTWDFDNRLTSVDTNSNGTLDATYTYDAIGRRVTKNNTVFACVGQQVMAEYTLGTSATSPTEQYVYGSYIDEPITKDGTGGTVYYHRNQQYSITGLTDGAGSVVEHYGYDAYGDVTIFDAVASEISNPATSNLYTYTARRYESETGVYFFRARYYDNGIGRFLGRDTLGKIDGLSLYRAYFVPRLMDPSGEAKFEVVANIMDSDFFTADDNLVEFKWTLNVVCRNGSPIISNGRESAKNVTGDFEITQASSVVSSAGLDCGKRNPPGIRLIWSGRAVEQDSNAIGNGAAGGTIVGGFGGGLVGGVGGPGGAAGGFVYGAGAGAAVGTVSGWALDSLFDVEVHWNFEASVEVCCVCLGQIYGQTAYQIRPKNFSLKSKTAKSNKSDYYRIGTFKLDGNKYFSVPEQYDWD